MPLLRTGLCLLPLLTISLGCASAARGSEEVAAQPAELIEPSARLMAYWAFENVDGELIACAVRVRLAWPEALSHIETVRFIFDQTDNGRMVFDDLEFTN